MFKGYGQKDRKFFVRLECKDLLKNLVKNYMENFGRNLFLEKGVIILCGRVGWKKWVNGVSKKSCGKWCGK